MADILISDEFSLRLEDGLLFHLNYAQLLSTTLALFSQFFTYTHCLRYIHILLLSHWQRVVDTCALTGRSFGFQRVYNSILFVQHYLIAHIFQTWSPTHFVKSAILRYICNSYGNLNRMHWRFSMNQITCSIKAAWSWGYHKTDRLQSMFSRL